MVDAMRDSFQTDVFGLEKEKDIMVALVMNFLAL